MNTKKFFIGGIVGGIIYLLLGWLAYGKLLVDYFSKHHGITSGFMRDPTAMPFLAYLILGNLLSGFLLAYVFAKATVNSFGSGLVAGGIIGFLVSSGYDCINYATTTLMSRPEILADVITYTIISAITGAIIGAIGSGKE